MEIKRLIVELEAYVSNFERMLKRFQDYRMDNRDEPVYRQKILEIRDLLADVGLIEYSNQIISFFNDGVLNFTESPSYASVQNVAGALNAALVRINRMAEQGQRELPAPRARAAANQPRRVFIGHGRSEVWRELKDFLVERLNIEYEEFNRLPSAGKSNKERIKEMLEVCSFALIVMTAEDETKDGKWRARENVVHEAGLFQGKLGFERAIIVLEEGCEAFSNIEGLIQLRFLPGKIMSCSEEIRRTLEREGLVDSKTTSAR